VRAAALILTLALAACSAGGCFLLKKPDKANIELRKENQKLQARVDELQTQSKAQAATIAGFEEKVGTLPTLPRDRLAKLYTTHEIRLGKLTGGADLDPAKPGHEGLKIYVTPSDQAGDQIKTAGTFTVAAFDLSREDQPKIGEWKFDLDAARQAWSSVLNRYNYVLTCPWQDVRPASPSLHVDVTFTDELTQAKFRQSMDVTVDPPK
jgi:hypothetical protein